MNNDPRRQLPGVSTLLQHPRAQGWLAREPRALVLDAIHHVLDRQRRECMTGPPPDSDAVAALVEQALRQQSLTRPRPVVNATGIVLHTGLGRAVLPQPAVDALAGLNRCCNLQIDLETGQRGKRNDMCHRLLCRLTGAEAATVVNNNAAATLLVLAALCPGKEVIISRGQLIEIGGSFRLPDCVHQSGAKLVEVGTTNKTHLRDYERALTDHTGMILRVNPSNYRVVGFSQDVPIADLATLKKKRPVWVVDDLGCGALIDLRALGLPPEPTVQDSIAAGADLALFSGDKLIGGPQSGIIVGRKDAIQTIKQHPLSRMLRAGKMTDVALEQTLRLFLEPDSLIQNHPTLRMLATPRETLRNAAENLKKRLESVDDLDLLVRETESATGGGSLPDVPLASYALAVRSRRLGAADLSQKLRLHDPPIIARIEADRVLLDLRTLMDGDQDQIVHALTELR
jgi:L-seryl-tRNA(Ser) seleniumtransferase